MIISAATIKKCQKIRHLHNNMSASVVNAVEDFAFVNFKIFPNPGVMTININFRYCFTVC